MQRREYEKKKYLRRFIERDYLHLMHNLPPNCIDKLALFAWIIVVAVLLSMLLEKKLHLFSEGYQSITIAVNIMSCRLVHVFWVLLNIGFKKKFNRATCYTLSFEQIIKGGSFYYKLTNSIMCHLDFYIENVLLFY